jgi:hypothetical protein
MTHSPLAASSPKTYMAFPNYFPAVFTSPVGSMVVIIERQMVMNSLESTDSSLSIVLYKYKLSSSPFLRRPFPSTLLILLQR